MGEYVVVITKDGFMTQKKIMDILYSDEVMKCRGTAKECNNFIHSIKPKRYEKSFNDDNTYVIDGKLCTATTEN